MADWLSLTGQQAETRLAPAMEAGVLLHPDVLVHLEHLREQSRTAGFELRITSGYRSFQRQRLIWNAKAAGERPLLDESGQIIDPGLLSDEQKLFAILRWSALPGCSRHHWGTDIDVYDANAVPADYRVQLTPAEVTGDGPFTPFHNWLDHVLIHEDAAFFRPYARDTGGIAPERWHLSCRPASSAFESLLDETRMIDWLMTQDIALKSEVRHHWHRIFHNYILINSTA